MGQSQSFNEDTFVAAKLQKFEEVRKRLQHAIANANKDVNDTQFWQALLSPQVIGEPGPAMQKEFSELERRRMLLAPKVQILNRLSGDLNSLETEALETYRNYARDVALYQKHPTDVQKGHVDFLRGKARDLDNRLKSLVQTFRDTKRY